MFFILLILVILFIRVYLFSIPGFESDINSWKIWAERLNVLGSFNFYSSNYFSDYFPGYLYILWGMGGIYKLILPAVSLFDVKFEIFVKSVTLFFEAATAFYIYKITERFIPKLKLLAPILYFANPATIFNSSVWGQIDGVFTFFLIYSSYLLIEKEKLISSSLWSSIAFLIKPQSIALLPAAFLFVAKQFKHYLIIFIFMLLVVTAILSIPFFGFDSIFGLLNLAKKSAEVYPYASIFAFNFWGIFGWWKPDNEVFFLFSNRTWGAILYLISLVLILSPLIKNKIKPENFYIAASLSFFSFFLFLTRMHERYLFPFLPFILIAAFLNKSKLFFSAYFIMTILHFINLWFVYYYYEYVYFNTNFVSNLSYKVINNNQVVLSILSIIVFLVVLIEYYRKFYVK